jgi:hypothetical protein
MRNYKRHWDSNESNNKKKHSRHCFVLSHIVTTQVDDPAATSEINIDFIEEVNGAWTSQEEWLTLWPEFTVTITDPYYIGPYNIGSFWVNGIPFFMADILHSTATDGRINNIYVLHERPITPPCVRQSLWEVITARADLSVFAAWVEAAGLTELFNTTNVPTIDGSYTVFAPTNTAFTYCRLCRRHRPIIAAVVWTFYCPTAATLRLSRPCY